MIVVATEDFELYHGVVVELRDRGATFTTVRPGEPLPDRTDLVLAGADDDLEGVGTDLGGTATDLEGVGTDHEGAGTDIDREGTAAGEDVPVVRADPANPRRAVEEAMAHLRGGGGRTVVGVDPGARPGIAVLHGDVVVAVFQVPLEDAVAVVEREVADAVDPVVRVGDGARLSGSRVVNDLEDVRVELVDETGTTPYLGTGVRESGDVVAAINIARLEGEVVDRREVEPTAGELQRIKDRSRERSPENRTIPAGLARRVARGELTVEEALAEHERAGADS